MATYYNGSNFRDVIDYWGELHVYHDDNEYHVHKHDTKVNNGTVYIDSKLGDWSFPENEEIHLEYPHSHKE